MLHSVVLYAAPVWHEWLGRYVSYRAPLLRIQRRMALRVICAYRTLSYEGAMLLARIPPIHLLAARLGRMHTRIREHRRAGTWTIDTYDEVCEASTILMYRQWQAILDNDALPARRIREAIMPVFTQRIQRHHGSMGYYITQLIGGHGSFGEYTCRIGKTPTAQCRYCDALIDSVEHTVTECPQWEVWRCELRGYLGNVETATTRIDLVTVRDLLPRMLDDPRIWKAFGTFALKVLTEKEVAEREGERDAAADQQQRRDGNAGIDGDVEAIIDNLLRQ